MVKQCAFTDIVAFLESSTHPELYHVKAGSHPGPNWYLKTICPTPNLIRADTEGYGRSWEWFAKSNSALVKLVNIAFDWEGEKIPYASSIWIRQDIDILWEETGHTNEHALTFKVVSKLEGNKEIAYAILKMADVCQSGILKSDDANEINKIIEAAQALLDQYDELDSVRKRKGFKVITNEVDKNNSE